MNDRHRTILLGFMLTIGFVAPFLVGFVAERQLRGIRYTAASPRATSPDGRPYWNSPGALRARFDVVQIGMSPESVGMLLGEPSQDEWIQPTHAETWFSEQTGVSYEKWGPPWKVYWLLTSAKGNSRWWSSAGCQAFVVYDDTGKVKHKMWFEYRRRSEAGRIVLPSLGLAVAACGIWLAVRIVNRRECWSRRTRIAAALLALPAAYMASFGPACWISSRLGTGQDVVSRIYQPILKLEWDSPRFISAPIRGYGWLYSADGWVFSGPSGTTENGVTTVDDTCRWMPDSP
jgi:hypothetical protein